MALHHELPIYKAAFDLLGLAVDLTRNIPRDFKRQLGDGVSIGDGDWFMSGGPCGSRSAMWTAVYSREYGLRWWVGCKRGISTACLREHVTETHWASKHADDYMAAIAFVEGHPGLARAMAANKQQEGV